MEMPIPVHFLQPVHNDFTGEESILQYALPPMARENACLGSESSLLQLNNNQQTGL